VNRKPGSKSSFFWVAAIFLIHVGSLRQMSGHSYQTTLTPNPYHISVRFGARGAVFRDAVRCFVTCASLYCSKYTLSYGQNVVDAGSL